MDPHETLSSDCQSVAAALRDFYLRSQRMIDRIMTARGASFARARLLLCIAERGACRSTDLAEFLGYAPRTVTEAIDALERDGLVGREPDRDDRRAKRISLTEQGKLAAENAEQARRDYVECVFGALTAAERGDVVRLFGRLRARLEELGG